MRNRLRIAWYDLLCWVAPGYMYRKQMREDEIAWEAHRDSWADAMSEEGARMTEYLEWERERDREEREWARDHLSPDDYRQAIAYDATHRR